MVHQLEDIQRTMLSTIGTSASLATSDEGAFPSEKKRFFPSTSSTPSSSSSRMRHVSAVARSSHRWMDSEEWVSYAEWIDLWCKELIGRLLGPLEVAPTTVQLPPESPSPGRHGKHR